MSQDSSTPPDPRSESHHSGDSLLDSIGRRTGRVPRTMLEDTDGDGESPILDPRIDGFQAQLSGQDRDKYRVMGEIASGGMGVVLRGHDKELGRDVAMKVVHEKFADRPEVIERFLEEAQVGGQLQHPGIVPVYELGLMSDQRPYFTMKLIKGHTLAKMFSRRRSVEEDRVRFLSIFESICQTMAYAHSKGVIHRDLKPANVMVGKFGEVQVVDWGLSKVMQRGGVADEIEAQDTAMSVIETVRSGPQTGSDSIVGNVLGTPAYMCPEQARGEVQQLDERADVFALGAILCEILTGAPPYVESEGKQLVQLAALAELDDARARIEGASAHEALKKLCLSCLMPSKSARPGSAEELAEIVHAHLSGLESAAHEAQLAAAEERLGAERSRRHLQMTLSIGALLILGGGSWWWMKSQREARQAEVVESFEVARLDTLERERLGAYAQAVDAARGGLRLVEAGQVEGALLEQARSLVEEAERKLEADLERVAELEREQRLLDFLLEIAMRQVGAGVIDTTESIEAEYRAAFRDYGLDLESPDLVDRLEELQGTEAGKQVAMGVNGWARILRQLPKSAAGDVELLNSIALDLDPDPLRTEIRLAVMERDTARLLELSSDSQLDEAEPESIFLLASGLDERDEIESARSVLTRGADRHPNHFLLNYRAARTFIGDEDESLQYSQAASYLRAALALRPDLPEIYMRLGDHYRGVGDSALAVHWGQKAVEAAPETRWNADVFAYDHLQLGRYDEAIRWFEREEATGFLGNVDESMLRYCRVMVGDLTPEEYLAWTEARATRGPFVWVGPARMLLIKGIVSPQDAAATSLELLQPFIDEDPENFFGWMSVARARLLLEDGPGSLEAVERAAPRFGPRNRRHGSQHALLTAAAHRLSGDDAAADASHRRALRLYRELTTGYEEEWLTSDLAWDFDHFEELAKGR